MSSTPPNSADNPGREVLDLDAAAEFLGVKTRTLGDLVRSGQVPAAKVGRQWRFLRSQLTQWLADGGSDSEPRHEAA